MDASMNGPVISLDNQRQGASRRGRQRLRVGCPLNKNAIALATSIKEETDVIAVYSANRYDKEYG